MTHTLYSYGWVSYGTHQYLSIKFETKNSKFLLNLIRNKLLTTLGAILDLKFVILNMMRTFEATFELNTLKFLVTQMQCIDVLRKTQQLITHRTILSPI